MTDPIDTALLPCPFCGENRASTYHVRDGRVAMCPACGAKSGSQFHGPLDLPSADQRAIAAWNTRAASQADTARQEGIALGLAMVAQKARTMLDGSRDRQTLVNMRLVFAELADAILTLAPIQPHVAAARVLLDMPPNKDGLNVLPDHMRAALKQIAKENPDA